MTGELHQSIAKPIGMPKDERWKAIGITKKVGPHLLWSVVRADSGRYLQMGSPV